LVTLYLTPVVYTFMASLLGKRRMEDNVDLAGAEPRYTFSD